MSGIIGIISVSAATPGAGPPIGAFIRSVDPSSTRVTLATPASGKRIRILTASADTSNALQSIKEFYFGTASTFNTDNTKGIMHGRMDLGVQENLRQVWADGAGPVGAVDEVVSYRTDNNIATEDRAFILYREE